MKSAQGRKQKSCAWCERVEKQGERFNCCSRCKVVYYCSKTCQRDHWRNGHRDTCQTPSERVEDMVKKAGNKSVDDDGQSKGWRKQACSSSSGEAGAGPAAEEEQNQKPSSRSINAAVDATGAPLSFGKHDKCAICLDSMRNPIRLPACGHWYCKECVERLRQSSSAPDTCPECRAPLPPGPGQLVDSAVEKLLRVERQVERLDGGWSNLPRELQREMDDVRGLLEQAADHGHVLAQYNLGVMYDQGQGVAQDFTKARE